MRTNRPTILAIMLLGLPGCEASTPEGSADTSRGVLGSDTGSPAADAAPSLTAECTNSRRRYRISYPEGWSVNTGEILPACSLFDSAPIRIARGTELPDDIAVAIMHEAASFARVTGEQRGVRVLTRTPTTVAGREAVRMEIESTGEALRDAGARSFMYVVNLGDASLILSTHDAGTLDFARKQRIVDAMVQTLELTGAR